MFYTGRFIIYMFSMAKIKYILIIVIGIKKKLKTTKEITGLQLKKRSHIALEN
jgi:hypothetical protein